MDGASIQVWDECCRHHPEGAEFVKVLAEWHKAEETARERREAAAGMLKKMLADASSKTDHVPRQGWNFFQSLIRAQRFKFEGPKA